MEKNVGFADSFIRIIIAVFLTVMALTGRLHGSWLTIGLLVAAILLVTGLISWCPIWRALGIGTRPSTED